MVRRTFDVYLTGANDKSPTGQMQLATRIAARYRLAAPVVAAALDGVPCRLAEGLDAADAEALVSALGTMGADARLSPCGARADLRESSAPLPGAGGARPSHELATAAGRKDGRITLKSADLEVPLVVDVAEPIDFAEPGPEARTGVRGPDTIRCQNHGLAYNRRRASGCVKCLASARAQARRFQTESSEPMSVPNNATSSLRVDPVRRAFWGLVVALFIGFLPTAYYARWSSRGTLLALRARQAELSSLPATKESLARFDALDAAVDVAYWRGAGRALLIWLAGTGIAGVVGISVTKSRHGADPDAQ
jgi:hypothetical protein